MTGNLDLETLKGLVAAGEIDTVVVAMVDMQGRLMGKRVTGHFFLSSIVEETHGCDYLLTIDMENEPVPGYEAANWDLGYGDFVFKPDLNTLRRIPWLEGTALVLCDLVDHHHHEDIPHSPRAILRKQLARLADKGWVAKMASELEFYLFDEPYDQAREKRYRDLKHAGWYIEDYHIFQTTKEEGVMRAIRKGLEGAGIPVENSKGEWAPARRRSTSATLTLWPWRTDMSSSRTPARRLLISTIRRSPSWPSGATTSPDRPVIFIHPCGMRLAGSHCSSMPRPSTECRRLCAITSPGN